MPPVDVTTRAVDETPSSGEARPSRDENDPDLPLYIGRFYVLKRIGRGGMGEVLLAYDEDLGRKVAIKLLRGEEGAEERDRIRREAQALAQLSHPNVVHVYEVGEVSELGDTVYLAMEFIQGEMLRTWTKGRDLPEILGAYLQAGRGLLAAHRAGLVHRDFKPGNVMVGRDGRVRVMDFGLARGALTARDPSENTVIRAAKSVLWDEMTQAGSVMGTPAYMAPEQWTRGAIDARTDQFAFCVALWDALYGERPFGGRSAKTLRVNILAGARRDPPPGNRRPAWLRRVLARGLEKEPERRWPSMHELLVALESGQARRRRRIAGVALLAALLVALAVLAYRRDEAARHAAACAAAGASIDEAWSPAIRDQVRAAFVAASAEFGPPNFERAAPWIDRFLAAWSAARVQVCGLAREDPRWSAELVGRGEECLQTARWSLESTIAALAEADAATVQRGVQVAASLPEVAPCLDIALLSRRPRSLPDDVAPAEATRLRKAIHAARSLHAVGRYKEGRERAPRLLEHADALGVASLAAEARMVAGALAEATSELKQAEAWFEEGLVLAAEAGEQSLMADAASALAGVVGTAAQRLADGLRWGRLAQALLVAQGEADRLRGADALSNLANIHTARGEFDTALALHTRALAIRARDLGEEHLEVARSLLDLGDVHRARGQLTEARPLYARALELRERNLGAEHPEVADALSRLASAALGLGDPDAAEPLDRRALEIREHTLGEDHPDVAESLVHLGAVARSRGQRGQAEAMLERALGILARVLGPDHPRLAAVLADLGDLYLDRGAHEPARKAFSRSLAITEKAHGPEHVDCARALLGIGRAANGRGRHAEAQRRLERATALFERLGLTRDAASARFALAIALWASKKTRDQALGEARAAAEALRGLAAGEDLARVEAWIAAAEAPPPPPRRPKKRKKK